MGRPIQRKWFGVAAAAGAQIIVNGVKWADGTTATSAYIVKQTGDRAYVVSNGSKAEICFLVNAATVGALSANQCFILCTPFGGTSIPCEKIAQYRLSTYAADGTVDSYRWSAIPAGAIGQADLITAAEAGFPVNTLAPAVTPTSGTGATLLTTTTGSWTGNPTITFSRQWTLGGVDIVAATSATYTTAVAGTYACVITASNASGSTVAISNNAVIA
jgi:hypothetical protein